MSIEHKTTCRSQLRHLKPDAMATIKTTSAPMCLQPLRGQVLCARIHSRDAFCEANSFRCLARRVCTRSNVLSVRYHHRHRLLQSIHLSGNRRPDKWKSVSAWNISNWSIADCLRRNYVDEATAQADNLTFANSNTFVLRADDTTVSIRYDVRSKFSFL